MTRSLPQTTRAARFRRPERPARPRDGARGRPSAAAEVTHDFLAATSGRTTLLITHRLEDLDDVDEVIDLSAGRIVHRGRPVDVLPGGIATVGAS